MNDIESKEHFELNEENEETFLNKNVIKNRNQYNTGIQNINF